ncbi:ABC transporter ATP-binding protein [Archaeoglobus veneficus]|uniref:Monosaccharide-transporting ATPase n=1 Tax=Archaeoglobus veneficus (strain DSM 11195 / SNP6) TaxID=693661 RepID=F2KRR9_ARCVS|nr:ABC transporter ATP-binding protein [Archaeoglobus veneficus]AEA47933.1 Monosaccharide-transporting ATPase [Archaeoglobus veneficus SNP6]
MLKVDGVVKKFGELAALNGVSFEVGGDECLGIIGPNGAGKTTLFNVITGFIKPDRGDVRFRGASVVGKKPNSLVKMGLVRTFQLIKVFRHMSVEENILAADGDGDILKKVGLWEKRSMVASKLSQGELRRLSIGLALAAKPRLLMLDEPFSGLSPAESRDLDRIIRDLKEDGIPLVIIEHKLKELFNLADRVLVLNFGEVIFEGLPGEAVRNKRVIEAYLGKNGAHGVVHAES